MNKSLGSMCLGAVMALAFSYHAAAADLPEIEKSGTLKVATEDDYAPFNFMSNGQADGFNKDMLEELRKYAKFHVDQSILPWARPVSGGLHWSVRYGVNRRGDYRRST